MRGPSSRSRRIETAVRRVSKAVRVSSAGFQPAISSVQAGSLRYFQSTACHGAETSASLRAPVKQSIVTLDMEGVLTPEVWIAVAERTGIPELRRTTRDEP